MPRTSRKYVISLDEMDIGLLPTSYIANCGKVAPLWSNTNLDIRNDNYYEFEIKSSHSDIKETNITENVVDNTICHICDIEVPTAYMKQHTNSNKHKVNIKIADIAMERIKKSYQNSVANDDNYHASDHFCTSCVLIVNKNDRISHEKSLLHKNSVIVDKFLHDFYLLYKNCNNDIQNNDNCDNDNDNYNIDDHDSKIVQVDNGDREVNDMKNHESIEDDKDIINEENDISNLDSSYDYDLPEGGNLKPLDDPLFRDMSKHVEEISNDLNDSITNVESLKESALQNSDESTHNSLSKIHSENNNEIKVSTKSPDSKKNVRVKAKRRKPKNKNKIQDKSENDEKNTNESIAQNGHNESGTEKNNNFYPNFGENDKKVELYKENAHFVHHVHDTNYSLCCKVCLVSLHDQIDHLNSYDHIVRYYDLLSKQSLVSEGSKTFCEACGVTIEKEDELDHCEDLKHIIKHEKYMKRLEKQ